MVGSLLGSALCCASYIVCVWCARPCGVASGAWLSLYCLPGTQVWYWKHSELVLFRFIPLCYIMKHWVQHNTTQHNTAQPSAAQRNTTQHNTTQHNTTQHSPAQPSAAQHNTTQHNTTQLNATQHNTALRNTTQHNTRVVENSQQVHILMCWPVILCLL
jgi:hypothetical protein